MNSPALNARLTKLFASSFAFGLAFAVSANAAPSKKPPTPRDVEVDTVKEAYWNRSADGDVEVVQNRQYSKKNRLSVQAGFGLVSSDPFLNVMALNGALGYHFTESLSVNAVYRKYLVSNSSYMDQLNQGILISPTGGQAYANTNEPQAFYGGEIEWSPLYGKISLSGTSIVHYDAHLLLGAGITDTETGKEFTPTIGVGPQFYLGNNVAIRLDYRLGIFKENLPQKNPALLATTGPITGSRTNYSHEWVLGLEFFL